MPPLGGAARRVRTERPRGPVSRGPRWLPLGEVARELREVRDAEAGRRVVPLARVAGVEDVVVIAARLAEWRDGTAATGGEGVNARVPQSDPVPEEGVDDRRRPVELR